MKTQSARIAVIAAAALLATHAIAQESITAKGVADLEQAKRSAVEADKDIRAAEPPAPPPAQKPPAISGGESSSERFDKAAEGAFNDRSKTRTIDHYRSADGVVIERITYAGKSYCVTSSTVNYIPGILHDSSKAREVTCPPANAGWVRK
ncbi:hypothetical protein [Massilia sp. TWR1-2-2]|uniref:hypothetical protein n=1 Tax=Massilia sp. TWR1-2-2 TaxID=2804584 RepID=UPI003CF26B63